MGFFICTHQATHAHRVNKLTLANEQSLMESDLVRNGGFFYQREPVQHVFDELRPLFDAHHAEISCHQDFDLDPNREMYYSLENVGMLRMFTARNQLGLLVGYMLYIVCPHSHYPAMKQATQDSLFVSKEKRGFGMAFMKWCNEQLKSEGVHFIFQQVNMKHDFGKVLKRMGFEPYSMTYSRRV